MTILDTARRLIGRERPDDGDDDLDVADQSRLPKMRPLPPLPLRVTEVDGNLLATRTEVLAAFRVDPVSWTYGSDNSRERMIRSAARTLVELTGRDCQVRVIPRPYPVAAYAHAYTANSRPPHSTPPNPAAFREHVLTVQQHLRHENLDNLDTYLIVEVAERTGRARAVTDVTRAALTRKERVTARRVAAEIAEVLAESSGMRAWPTVQAETDRIITCSAGLGLPEPRVAANTDLPAGPLDVGAYTDGVDVDPRPGSRTLRIRGHENRYGDPVDRYVAVLSMGRTPEYLDVPQVHDPWIAYSQRLSFPVQWSVRFTVQPSQEAIKALRKQIKNLREEQRGSRAARLPEDPERDTVLASAVRIEGSMRTGDVATASRVVAWADVAVTGRTPEETAARARATIRHYAGIGMTLEWGRAQEARYRAFIPGEKRATSHYRRPMALETFAAAMPHVSAHIGDTSPRGDYLGHTQGASKRVCVWDMHAAMEEHDRSGFTPILGGLGAGKSGLTAALVAYASLRGIPSTVFDPSGPLAALCSHPDLAEHAEHVDLTRGADGLLSPYAVVPDPSRVAFNDDPAVTRHDDPRARTEEADRLYAEAVVAAEKAREGLAIDVLTGLLPINMRARCGEAVRRTVREVGTARRTTTLATVLDYLRRSEDRNAKAAAEELDAARRWPQCRLLFGSDDALARDDRERGASSKTLTVITMAGLPIPKTDDESRWSEAERVTMPLLTAAAHYASRRVYSKPMRARALVAFDEGHVLRTVTSGAQMLDRLARDCRKWNTRVLVASHKPSDFLSLDVDGLLGEPFIGRMGDDATPRMLADALRLGKVPGEHGYERHLASLSPQADTRGGTRRRKVREFMFTDVHGNHEVIAIDLAHRPDLLALIDTTPGVAADDLPTGTYGEDDVFDPAKVPA